MLITAVVDEAIAERVDMVVTDLARWQRERFVGDTRYEVVTVDSQPAIRAYTRQSASALYQRKTVNVEQTPLLYWTWRVDAIYAIDDPEKKRGDDYAARIYIVVKEGIFPWQTYALNYVWCNRSASKPYWPNPFTRNAVMIPVRCGEEGLGQWQHQRVNIAEDYWRIFGRRIKQVDGIAIMSDSDNAGGEATAYYREIYFASE